MSKNVDFDEIFTLFNRDGFVVLGEFYNENEIEAMNREISAHYSALVLDREAVEREKGEIFKQFETEVIPWNPCGEENAVFNGIRDDDRLRQVTEACIKPGFSANGSLVMLSVAGGKGQAWHQDCPATDPRSFNLNRLIYTEQISADNGAVVLVPGSHRQGHIPSGGSQEPIAGERFLTPSAGTLVLMNGHVFHRVTPNTSTKPRLSVNFRAFPAGVAPEICNIGVYRNGAFDFGAGKIIKEQR